MLGITENSDSSAVYVGTTPNEDTGEIVEKQLWIQKRCRERPHLEIEETQSFYAEKANSCVGYY